MAREKDRLHRPSWTSCLAVVEAVAQLLSSMCRVKNWEMRRWHPLPGCTRRLHARWCHGRSCGEDTEGPRASTDLLQ